MKNLIFTCLGLGLFAGTVNANEVSQLTAESRAIVKKFAGSLKGELQGAIKAAGPVNAIQVCNNVAPAIAKDLSVQYNGQVARTSLKYRNSKNKPDAWETNILQDFERRKSAGTPIKQLEVTEIVNIDGKKMFRYMKAIPTGEVCLKCHGKVIEPALQTKLETLYPDDRAKGFVKGDIRGAFTLLKEIK